MTTEPTQTNPSEAFERWVTTEGFFILGMSMPSIERGIAWAAWQAANAARESDLALSTQRIAELEAQLRAQASELTEAVRLARKFDVETVHLQERVKQLEGALIRIRDLKTHVCGGAESIAEQALSPSPPAVEVALNSDSFKCPKCAWIGSRDQLKSVRGVGNCPQCWLMRAEAIIPIKHPPVQTEEKPATVPLAVAEGLE